MLNDLLVANMKGLGIARLKSGKWFAVQNSRGGLSSVVFRSPFRAAEHAMYFKGCVDWLVLARQGVRVVPVVIDEPDA